MGRCGLFNGRNAHQPFDGQIEISAAMAHEINALPYRKARFLGFVTGIDLHIKRRPAAGFLHRLDQGARQLLAIQRFDDVKQGAGVFRLVGLKRSDEAQLQIRVGCTAIAPASLRLLHPVFTKNALAGGQHGVNPLIRLNFGDGDQINRIVGAPRLLGRFGDTGQNLGARCGDAVYGSGIKVCHGDDWV